MSPNQAPAAVSGLTRTHYVQLDGMRGLAILLVMAYHLCLAHSGFQGPGTGIVLQLAQGGWLGVDLFFVLSGFLITGILLDTRSTPHYLKNFLARRFLRIWPLYYLNLFVLLVILPLAVPAYAGGLHSMREKQLWFWLYGANWLFAREGGFGQTSGGYFWSLAVEEQFYLIWPLVVYWLSTRALLRTCVTLLVLSLISRLALAHLGVNTNTLYTMTFTHLDGLSVGSMLAVTMRSPDAVTRLRRFAPAVALAALCGMVVVRVADGNLFFWSRTMATYGYTVAVILFGALLTHVLLLGKPSLGLARFFRTSFMTRAGKYSYALYMVHVPVASALGAVAVRTFRPIQSLIGYEGVFLIYFAASFLLSWALAVASWHLIEKRLLALKRHFAYGEADRTVALPGAPQVTAAAREAHTGG